MRYLIYTFLFFSFLSVSAQEYTAEQLMNDAKEGAMLFRLPAQRNKIEALKKAGRAEEARILAETVKANQEAWIVAMKSEYKFGLVYFFYDYYARDIMAGDLSNVFDANRTQLDYPDLKFVVVGPDQTENLNIDGLVLLTPKMEPVPKGMPNFISAYGFLHLSKKTQYQMAKELSNAMIKYHK